jgi:DNA-binding GntR family transcriptional regulator
MGRRHTSTHRDRSPSRPGEDLVRTLRDRISREIRRMIIASELRPGERLLQQPLAKKFGVSQSVMREALLEAQFSGLVVSTNGAGASVAQIDLQQVMQAWEVREMLEGLAARLCCQRAAPAHLRELTEMAHQIHACGIAAQETQRAQLDRAFHERIIDICANGVVQRLSQGYHIVRLAVLKVVPHDQILADHMAIVDAIRAGDEPGAEAAARRHVVNARELVKQQFAEGAFSFPWDAAAKAPAVGLMPSSAAAPGTVSPEAAGSPARP